MDAVYGCDTCRTTIGRAGCPTHRDSNTYTDEAGAYHYTGSRLVITHCIHGLDLRLHPRCYLCNPVRWYGVLRPSDEPHDAALREMEEIERKALSDSWAEGFNSALSEASERVRALPAEGTTSGSPRYALVSRAAVLRVLEGEPSDG